MKLKRIIAIAAAALFTSVSVLANPMVTSAREEEDYQTMYWENGASEEITEIPIVCSEPIDEIFYAYYFDCGHEMAEHPDLFSDEMGYTEEERQYLKDKIDIVFVVGVEDGTEAGDVITIKLPFSYPVIELNNWDEDGQEVSVNGDTATITCNVPSYIVAFSVMMTTTAPDTATQDNFWFKPMENALVIAASEVQVNGGTAVAKATGDFALSYDIMKWLDEHPGVILEYTLNYKDAEHLIVIPGGGNCADPTIPWYGPEYLKKYYESR